MPRLATAFSGAERAGGKPVELYTFRRGTETWNYTSAETEQTVDGLTYTPATIQRKAVEQKQDTPGLSVVVSVSLDTPFGVSLTEPGFQIATVSIRRQQTAGDPVKMVLLGQLVSCKFVDNDAVCTFATVEQTFKTPIPRFRIARTCQHALYSTGCGVSAADFATATTITDITRGANQSTVTVAETLVTAAMKGGMLRLANGRLLFIATNVGSALTVWGRVPSDVVATDAVTLYPGCDKLFDTCEGTFDNAENFGGFPNLPDRDPNVGRMF